MNIIFKITIKQDTKYSNIILHIYSKLHACMRLTFFDIVVVVLLDTYFRLSFEKALYVRVESPSILSILILIFYEINFFFYHASHIIFKGRNKIPFSCFVGIQPLSGCRLCAFLSLRVSRIY